MNDVSSSHWTVLVSLVGLFIFSAPSHADTRFNLGIGGAGITSQQNWAPGLQLGIQWSEKISSNFYYSYALQGVYRSLAIKEKRAISYPGIITLRDYSLAAFYIDAPVKIHYCLNPHSTNTFVVFAGLSLNLCFSANAEDEILKTLYDPNDPDRPSEPPPYDYSHIEDPGPIIPLLENSDFALLAGVEWSLFRHPLALTYMYGRIGSVSAIEFMERYHSITLSISFHLNPR